MPTRPPGSRLGPYEIHSLIGVGGMGEVYRARDTRLGRDVAVKILSPALAADADAMARFEREARAVAALSHANIIALFDIGHHDGSPYLVTELLDGMTLRDRLRDAPLPVRKAIDYARQIAAALSAAHDRGVIHRDLKPENIIATTDGQIKILDFGVAHLAPAAVSSSTVTIAPSAVQTAPGMIVGTVGYMAPEQVRGEAVDHRTDIFAFGAVLYELLTGRRAFEGATAVDTMSAVLNSDPALIERPDAVIPRYLQRVIHRCLEKIPVERFQSARDLAFALDVESMTSDAMPASESARPRRAWWRDWRVAAVAVAAAALASGVAEFGRRSTGDARTAAAASMRFGIPASTTWSDGVSVSPDGRYLVYTSEASSSGRFWLRRLDSLDAQPLSDTASASPYFFWSPDSRFLGYRAGNAVIIREIPAGEPRVLAELPSPSYGAAWGPDGDIAIATQEGLFLAKATGGSPRLLQRTDPTRELSYAAPSFLPGRRVLFTAVTNGQGEQSLETRVAGLDGRALGVIGTGMVGAGYVDGQLLFGSGGALFSQPFDVDRLALTGDRVRLAASVVQDWRSGALGAALGAGASSTGVLAFRVAPHEGSQFTIVDRSGRTVRTVGAPDTYFNFDLSPDGRQIIAARRNAVGSTQYSLLLIDVVRGVTSLVTDRNDSSDANDPTWAPDGQHIAYMHGDKLVMRLANGGVERTLVAKDGYPDSFTRDGRFLTYGLARGNFFEAWAVDLVTPGAKPIALVTGVSHSDETRFSPNGRWVAYHSNQNGTEVYVIPFPPDGQRWQISQAGGLQPRWSEDGNELFFLSSEGRLMAVRMPGSDPRGADVPQALFVTGVVPSDSLDQFTPMRDQFLIRAPISSAVNATAVQVVVNWKAGAAR